MLDWDHAHVTWASDTWLIDSCFCHRVWLICHYGDLPFFYKQCQSYCVLPFLLFFFFFKFHAHCVCACAFCNPLIWACCCRLYSVKLKLNTCKFTPLLLYIRSLWRRKKKSKTPARACAQVEVEDRLGPSLLHLPLPQTSLPRPLSSYILPGFNLELTTPLRKWVSERFELTMTSWNLTASRMEWKHFSTSRA